MLYPLQKENRPDIFSFQETHSTSDIIQSWATLFGKLAQNVIYSHGTANSRGVLLGFSEHLGINIVSSFVDPDCRFAGAHVQLKKEAFTVVAIYLEPSISQEVWTQTLDRIMTEMVQGRNPHVLFCGDFNAVLDNSLDKFSPKGSKAPCRSGIWLKQYMDIHELTDVWRAAHPEEKCFTCFGQAISRIDLALASPSFLTHVLDLHIDTSYLSDHAPVIVDFSLANDSRGPGFWHLPQHFLSDPAYVKMIENLVDEVRRQNKDLNPSQLWDFLKLSIRSKSIQFSAQAQQARKAWVKQINSDIQLVSQAREKALNARSIRSYSEKLALLQWNVTK